MWADLKVCGLSDNGLAQFGESVRVLAGGHRVVVSDGGEGLVVQQLLSDLTQTHLKLLLSADVAVSPHQDDRRQRSHRLKRNTEVNTNMDKEAA